jgi:hypothetical protein
VGLACGMKWWAMVYDIKNSELRIGLRSGVIRFELRPNNGLYFMLLIVSTTLMKEPHTAPENDKSTHSSRYSLSSSMNPQSAKSPRGTMAWMNQILPSIALAAFTSSFLGKEHCANQTYAGMTIA